MCSHILRSFFRPRKIVLSRNERKIVLNYYEMYDANNADTNFVVYVTFSRNILIAKSSDNRRMFVTTQVVMRLDGKVEKSLYLVQSLLQS